MRHIPLPLESEAPEVFRIWKRRHPRANYGHFKDIRAKRALRDALIKRQKYLCCYCETRIGEDNSHIEHIEPQFGGLSEKSMDYSNMAASCIKDPKKEDPRFDPEIGVLSDSMLHCGHARGTNTVVSPYDRRCEEMFSYSFGGEVRVNPALSNIEEIRLAQDSIDFLRLNVSTLTALRRLAMFETVKMLEGGLSEFDILREINGRLPPFVSAAKAAIGAWKLARERAA